MKGLTVRSDRNIHPLVRSHRSTTSVATPSGGLETIRPWAPGGGILDGFRRLFPLRERTEFGLPDDRSAQIDKLLDTRSGFVFRGIELEVGPAAQRSLGAFQVEIVFHPNADTGQGGSVRDLRA